MEQSAQDASQVTMEIVHGHRPGLIFDLIVDNETRVLEPGKVAVINPHVKHGEKQ